MIMKEKKSKLELQYPCRWQYKAIGRQKEQVLETVQAVFQDYICEISYSNSSKTGKYHSFMIEMTVAGEDERNMLYQALKDSPHIVIVI